MLVKTLVQLALTATPMLGAMLVAARLGVRRVPALLGIALAGSGAAAMIVFWAYYLFPSLGGPCAYAMVGLGLLGAIWALSTVRRDPALLRRLAVPFGLWALGSLFLVFFGFLHGGTATALTTGATRFSTHPTQLASDNFIPYFYDDWMFAGHPGAAPIWEPNWMFSDRPPLQIGYLLSQRVFGWDATTLHAELIGVIVQQFWIIGLWAVLEAAQLARRLKGLIIVAALVSDVAILNGFFTWPKLLAAAMVLAAIALIASPRSDDLRRESLVTVLFGVLFGLAYLAHGSAVFGLIAILVVLLWRHGLPGWRWLGAGLAAALIVVLPWTAYQHWGDPPGNRVVKWTLAGATEVDDRGLLDEIGHAYSQAGLGNVLNDKLQNFLTMVGGGHGSSEEPKEWIHFSSAFVDTAHAVRDVAHGHFGDAASEIRESRFSHLLWALGLIIIGLPVIAVAWLRGVRPHGPEWDLAKLCAALFGIGVVLWGLIVFGNMPSRTIITEGSLAMPLLAMTGILAALWPISRRWAWWLVGLNVGTVLILYTPTLEKGGLGTSYTGFSVLSALLATLALIGFGALALGGRDRPGTPAA